MNGRRTVVGGRRGGLLWLTLVAAVTGALVIVVAITSQQPEAPQLAGPIGTTEAPARERPASGGSSSGAVVTPAKEVPLGPSEPVSISIPAIDVSSDVFSLGLAPDGTLAVPQPGPDLDKAAWFENSPTPGQPGPSVIEGHVSTAERGPSIFHDLAELRPGDTISVEREDGSTAVFTVDGLREFPKDEFPTELVYGGDLGTPTLRLITCSNFDPSVGSHASNLIVFSHLSKVIEA